MSQHHSEAFLQKVRRIGRMINTLGRVSPALAGRAAFRLFCTPRRQSMRIEDRDFLNLAQAETLLLENIAISAYTWSPVGKPLNRSVLLLHGWESHSGRWRKFVPELLEAGYTVMAFDAPAHGRSGGNVINLPLFSRVLSAFVAQKGVRTRWSAIHWAGLPSSWEWRLSGRPGYKKPS